MFRSFQISLLFVLSATVCFAQDTVYTFKGSEPYTAFGQAVSGAGDVNGDGYADIIIGDPTHPKGVGKVVVYSGSTAEALYTIQGPEAGTGIGSSVCGAGDINQDGYDDFAIGLHTGLEVRVYSGVDGSLIRTLQKTSSSGLLGASVSAGDINNDNMPDIVVGDPYDLAGGNFAGSVTVFSGADGSRLYYKIGQAEEWFGGAVAAVGDVNADGYGDFAVGGQGAPNATYSGLIRVYSGKDGTELYTFNGGTEDYLGMSVSGAGDVDGDGYDDILGGAPAAGGIIGKPGKAMVYSGKTGNILYTFTGKEDHDQFGWSVAKAGDINSDGVPDFAISAQYNSYTKGYEGGEVIVYSGKDGSEIYSISNTGTRFGMQVANAGDVNKDGHPNLIVGAPGVSGVYGEAKVFSYDYCTTDPNKYTPGICGCGTADTDANNNGTADCLINAELKARLARQKVLLGGLKSTNTGNSKKDGKRKKKQRKSLKELRPLSKGILSYVKEKINSIVLANPKAKLEKLAKVCKRKALLACRTSNESFGGNKKKAKKANRKLDKAVAEQE